jgi:regulator of cell morphogenesis and NO signaling
MVFSPETTVGELAGRFPDTARVFRRRGVEFCCGGHRTLAQVCRTGHIDYSDLAAELVEAALRAAPRHTWADRPVAELVEHLVESFHDPLRREFPRLKELAARLQGHGDTHRRVLAIVYYELTRLDAELAAQMDAEECELFPLAVRLERQGPADGDRARVAVLRSDADDRNADFGQTLHILRQITDGFAPPSTACSSLRALYHGLEELEALMQQHVHLERNVLFPRAAALVSEASLENHR